MLVLGLGLTDAAVVMAADRYFPTPPAGFVLLIDEASIFPTSPSPLMEEDEAIITEEI